MREIKQKSNHSYVFSRYLEPIETVPTGETVVLYTEDCFMGYLDSEAKRRKDVPDDCINPQTGPVYIEGAQPGDTLAVHILDIERGRDWAVSCLPPFFGGLTSTHTTPTLQDPLPEKIWIYRRQEQDGMFAASEHLRFPWNPFLGTIATAPPKEAISTLTPFEHGGNMDAEDVKPGNIIYLPVAVEGAYFFAGDCHANQGQGELCGVAMEISAKVTLRFELIKNKKIGWPRIESPTEFMAVGSARPMEDAARIAYAELLGWLTEIGWDKYEAYQLLTQAGKLYVANMVDTNYSLVAKIDKALALRI